MRATLPLIAFVLAHAMAAAAQEQPVSMLQPQARVREPFTWIRGLVELPDGRLLIADQSERALYVTDVAGADKRQLGTNGAGPREYRDPIGLFALRGDTALIYDLLNARFVKVTGDELLDVLPFAAMNLGETRPRAVDESGRLYWDHANATRLQKRTDPGANQTVLLRLTPGQRADTIATLAVPGPVNPGPMSDYDRWAVGRDGRIAIVRNQDDYRVDWVDASGAITQGVVVREPRRRLTAADRTAIREGTATNVPPSGSVRMGGAPARPPEIPLPDDYPYARAVSVDRSGRAWVWRFGSATETTSVYDVFDARGRRIARYGLRDNSEILGFGNGVFYAARKDADGLQWVEQYRIDG